MAFLGVRPKTGVATTQGKLSPGTSLWVVTWGPKDLPADQDFEVWHGAVRGPGGYFLVYIDDAMFGAAENGLINEYAPAGGAMYVRKGQEISFNWSIGSGNAPQAWIYLRQPEIGRI